MDDATPQRLDFEFVRRTWRLARPYWTSDERRNATLLGVVLVVLLVAYTEFSVLFNEQSGEFTSALAARDGPRFWRSILLFFGLIAVGVPIDALYYFVRDKLALHWRRWLTARLLGRYLDGRAYYHLVGHPSIDNPDQRIADDIYSFTNQSLSFLLVFGNALFQLAAFSRVLWSISSSLVLLLFAYALAITVLTLRIFGEKMVSLNFTQRQREADFRFGLVRLREYAEPIAFYHGERQERARLEIVFARLFENASRIIRWSLGLNCFYYANGYLALVLPALVIAPRVLSGELEVGRIVQATGAFAAVLGALTILVDNMESLSRFAASVGRLETFSASLAPGTAATGRIRYRAAADLVFDHVTLLTPEGGHAIVRDLSLVIAPGEHLLIAGASGVGKSSLLRAIAGLWDAGAGTIGRPPASELLFLPQHAYLPIGSLRGQLHYPRLDRPVPDPRLHEALERVNLGGLAQRCGGLDAEVDLEKTLSVGERQRLAFARILLTTPRFALLDEATSALDPENEALLYQRLRETRTTFISVSHHAALMKHHSRVLELRAGGAWRACPTGQFRFTEELA